MSTQLISVDVAQRRLRRLLLAGAVIATIWVVLPIYFLVVNAWSSQDAVNAFPKAFVPEMNHESLSFLLGFDGVLSSLVNSLIVAAITMIFSIGLGAPAGYALARYEFRGKGTFRLLILLTRAFPLPLLALPLTVLYIRLGVDDTLVGLALVHTMLALPFAVLITFSLFSGVPTELEEAAWVFGCTKVQAFRRVVLPIALPGLAASAIFAFVISWNEVFASSVLMIQNRTLTAFLLQNLDVSPMHMKFAGGALLVLPAATFMFLIRKHLFAMWGISNRLLMANIAIQNVTKSFGSYDALKGIGLAVADQEFLVLLGASGCGKSTLLRIIAGLETADVGEVHVGGERIDQLQAKDRRLAMVFQNYAVFPHLTVFENIAFGLRMQKRPQEVVAAKVNQVARMVHLEALLDRYSGQLSGGQRQRVALARALAVEPRVMLMDEPLSNLDALLRLEMRAELKSILAASKTTTIYVTHDQVEAMSLADRIAVMHQGVIVQCDTPLEIYRNPVNTFVAGFIGNPPMNFIPAHAVQDGIFEARGLRLQGPLGHRELLLGIRPEDMQVGDAGFTCQADLIEPLGPNVLVTDVQDSAVFRAALSSTTTVSKGQSIFLQPDLERVRWFTPEGQSVESVS